MTVAPVRLSVVVPAFHEVAAIGSTVARLRQGLESAGIEGPVEVVVADDGSADGTAEAAERAGADRVLRLPAHRGKGAAVREGVLAAEGRTVVFTDADLAYPPEQIAALVLAVESGGDVVVGSRRHVDTVTLVRNRRIREVTGRAFNLLTRALLPVARSDTQCGLKAFSSAAAHQIFGASRVDGFAFDVEVFVLADALGLTVEEVPVELANSDRSSVRLWPDALTMVRDLARIRWWMSTGGYRDRLRGAGGADRGER